MANTARDLQSMLTVLGAWCQRWGLTVNPRKTKVVHFRPRGKPRTNFAFMCGNDCIEVVNHYKYLGLWFSDDINLKYMAEQVAASAHRALGLVIAKSKSIGSLPYQCFTKLYDSLVQSVIDYGACVWGSKEFECIKAVQHRAMRFFLGVHKKTTNSAVLGEMGWTPQEVHQKVCVMRQLLRYSRMKETRINLHVMKWALGKGCNNWLYQFKSMLKSLDMCHLMNFDLRYGKSELSELKDLLMSEFIEKWMEDLSREVKV